MIYYKAYSQSSLLCDHLCNVSIRYRKDYNACISEDSNIKITPSESLPTAMVACKINDDYCKRKCDKRKK